jgi:hypothetical protein
MNDFARAAVQLDPVKRVKYSFGLVLGVDEFRQEQYHILTKFRRHHRRLHGTGTVWGLKVNVPPAALPENLEVQVEPGLAISLGGHEICVPARMCAKLNAWLGRNATDLNSAFGAPPYPLSLCVVLCYRECETDTVPIPGEPCRSDDAVLAPSRIADSFELKLCIDTVMTSPPSALPDTLCICPVHTLDERSERELGGFLRRLQVTSGLTNITPDNLRAEVLRLGDPSALDSGSPPSTGPQLQIHPEDLDLVVRTWAVEVLPLLQPSTPAGACGPDEAARCVLLARLDLQVGGGNAVVGSVTVDESERPILLATQDLQEWLTSGGPTWI